MKKRLSDEQIIIIFRKAEAGFLPVSSAVSKLFPTPPFTFDVRSMAVWRSPRLSA